MSKPPISLPKLHLAGERYGHLLVLSEGPRSSRKRPIRQWLCRCDCGTEKLINQNDMRAGRTVSCGCVGRTRGANRTRTHGMRHSPEYQSWQNMRRRCSDPTNHHYANYGGRGITVCERWQKFENFLADMGPRPSADYSIERDDTNGNYEPDNCRWATDTEQANNRRNTRMLTFRGETLPRAEWARRTGLSYWIIRERIDRRGWSVERALTTPGP